jgi:nucleotide-binding universal stress UspA family protein
MFVSPDDTQLVQHRIDLEREDARCYLERVQEMNSLSGVQTETEVIIGEVASTLLSVAETTAIDLIVMCRHGQGRFVHWPLGSVTGKIAYHSPIPVLMLREGEALLAGSSPSARGTLHALVPLDGSELAQAALEPALQMIEALSPDGCGLLHLTQVVVLPQEEHKRETISQQAKAYLHTIATRLHEKHVSSPGAASHLSITWSVTRAEDPASGILWAAEESEHTEGTGIADGSDLIVMTTHGYGGLRQWVMGRVTERVLHVTRLPLLIVPPPEKGHDWPRTGPSRGQ